jgi:hypothetical protein
MRAKESPSILKLIFLLAFLEMLCTSQGSDSHACVVVDDATEEQNTLLNEIKEEIRLAFPSDLEELNEFSISVLLDRIDESEEILEHRVWMLRGRLFDEIGEVFESDTDQFLYLVSSPDPRMKEVALSSVQLSELDIFALSINEEPVYDAVQDICHAFPYYSKEKRLKREMLDFLYRYDLFGWCFDTIVNLTKDDSEPDLARKAANYLCNEPPWGYKPRPEEELIELLDISSEVLHQEAVIALAFYEYEPIIPDLVEIIEDEDVKSEVRLRAIESSSRYDELRPQKLLDSLLLMLWPNRWFTAKVDKRMEHSLDSVLGALCELEYPINPAELLVLRELVKTIDPKHELESINFWLNGTEPEEYYLKWRLSEYSCHTF